MNVEFNGEKNSMNKSELDYYIVKQKGILFHIINMISLGIRKKKEFYKSYLYTLLKKILLCMVIVVALWSLEIYAGMNSRMDISLS